MLVLVIMIGWLLFSRLHRNAGCRLSSHECNSFTGTKSAIAEQLQLGQRLRRKIERVDGNSGDESTDASSDGSEEEAPAGGAAQQRGMSSKARKEALALLSGEGQCQAAAFHYRAFCTAG